MVGILLMSHGDLSQGVISSYKTIIGEPEKIEVLTLHIEDNTDEFEQKMISKIDELDDGDGVLVMVDLLGGTPCNKSAMQLRDKNIEVLTGLNFPMLVCAYEKRLNGGNLQEIKDYCLQGSKDGIVSLREHFHLDK